jgi:tetratricopeptide (TPR) repeat protein
MLKDRYDLALTTMSPAARDAYVQASDLALTFYPGALDAYDRAIAADPGFALAYVGKALVLLRQGDAPAARAALVTAKGLASGVTEREASHIAYFDLVFAGETMAAIAALHPHLAQWPRDALVVASAANPNGLIGGSGRLGQKREIAELMDRLAPHYGDDFWFGSYHAMALSEDGQFAPARAIIERSVAANPNNAHGAHGVAHICYETGDLEGGRRFLSSWLATYPRDGFFHGHLSWHLSLFEIQAGNWTEASRLYRDAIALDRHSGGPQQKISDGAAFLWRSELAGQPRDAAAWRALHGFAKDALPRPGNGLYDLHVILAQSVMGDEAQPDTRASQIEALAREGRYLSGSYLPALARGFAAFEREDFSAAIEALAPLAGENERIGGSRAQHDLIEFTLLSACLGAHRLDKARDLLAVRRPGASGIPVAGVAAVR